jgi:Flp pilus assembly protein TadG
MMQKLKQHFQGFARDERGSILLETVIMLPLLLWALLAMVVYWDAYRSINRLDKATYALADTLSRQQAAVPVATVDRWDDFINFMLDDNHVAQVRVTSYRWVQANNRFEVLWSRSPGSARPQLTTASLVTTGVVNQLPMMGSSEYGVLTETWVNYQPPLSAPFMGAMQVSNMTLTKVTPTPMRFSPLCLVGMTALACTG